MTARQIPPKRTHGRIMQAQTTAGRALIRRLLEGRSEDEIPAIAKEYGDGIRLLLTQPN